MKILRPDFYEDFHCTASACTDSCCIGWEVVIDPFTEGLYREMDDPYGEIIRSGITTDDEGDTCFRMKDGRCVFLNENGLCNIILNLGEGALCDICTEHPRFYNYYPGCREDGLGLCCEEVCRLLLTREAPLGFVLSESEEDEDDEPETIEDRQKEEWRREVCSTIQDRRTDLFSRFEKLLEHIPDEGADGSCEDLLRCFEMLEKMEPAYDRYLDSVRLLLGKKTMNSYEQDLEQILVMLLFRYGLEDLCDSGWNPDEILLMTLSFAYLVFLIDRSEEERMRRPLTLTERVNIIKCMSKNIEYSTENIPMLIRELKRTVGLKGLRNLVRIEKKLVRIEKKQY